MRWKVLEYAENAFKNLSLVDANIAIVGGNKNDPEVLLVKKLFVNCQITFLGVEKSPEVNFLDLNEKTMQYKDFDLVICSQVIEHVWHQGNFLWTLERLTKRGGYLWISCPYNNHPHGSPDYFSAGFSVDYLAKNLQTGYEILFFKEFGSKRYFISSLLRNQWLSEEEHKFPMKTRVIKGNSIKYAIYHYLRFELLWLIYLSVLSPRIRTDRFVTESVVLAKKL